MTRLSVGDRVRVERDETKHPSKGTWPRYRGHVGTVVEVNAHRIARLTEYGVTFGAVRTREDRPGALAHGGATWFQRHELTRLTEPDE